MKNIFDVEIGDIMVATKSLTYLNRSVTKGNTYVVVGLNPKTFTIIDDTNNRISLYYQSVSKKSKWYIMNSLSEQRIKKIKSLGL